ncbi:hypothetical protein OESDEN_08148 [Oesophagostomum dentatum]|uniref:Uncharacterized protein n=1 Tax=Oesophagostomum dentatum TaxID=61180 RepID=A0A0B1T414_OESDE|nr:hypothetical protein OESDEN_08148 [Oesophagostomum dentatum]
MTTLMLTTSNMETLQFWAKHLCNESRPMGLSGWLCILCILREAISDVDAALPLFRRYTAGSKYDPSTFVKTPEKGFSHVVAFV